MENYRNDKILISCKSSNIFKIYSCKPKLNKNKTDDVFFEKNPDLVKLLTRTCSFVYNEDTYITSLQGPVKFTGYSDIDEDPETDDKFISNKNNTLLNTDKIIEWRNNNELEIIVTKKENGKLAAAKIFTYNDEQYVICGSKNNHIIFSCKDKKYETDSLLVKKIADDIIENLDKFTLLMNLFDERYSIIGELCDGEHFFPGDNKITWFGLFKQGLAMDTIKCYELLEECGLKTVEYFKYYGNENDLYIKAKSENCEGYVVRYENIKTKENTLVKMKSSLYIVKRFFRQILLNGYKNIYNITNRFIDASEYHCLNTNKSAEITNKLLKFGFWMMDNKYSTKVLGFGENHGFQYYYSKYLSETNTEEIVISIYDIGEFNKNEYLKAVNYYKKRNYNNPVIVIFMQGLQGSGKSYISKNVCEYLQREMNLKATYIEQDMFNGDTLSTQGAFYHLINKEEYDVIILSRCNANSKQYSTYLNIAFELPTKIIFVSHYAMPTAYYMALAGIVNRSINREQGLYNLGNSEFTFLEIEKIVKDNFMNFERHEKALILYTFKGNENFMASVNNCENKEIFINEHIEIFNSLRVPINNICKQFKDIIECADSFFLIKTNANYISLELKDDDKKVLKEFSDLHTDFNCLDYNEHVTLKYKPKKEDFENFLMYEKYEIHITKLVIYKKNACAYLVSKIMYNNEEIKIETQAHVTSKVPYDQKPAFSLSYINCEKDVSTVDCNFTFNTVLAYK